MPSLIATFVLALAGTGGALAQDMHQHMHMQGGTAVAQLQLDAGKKWPTDASLRSGMAAIRQAFDADHPAIHSARETDAQYDALAAKIEAQVNDIVKSCKLPPAADASLHYIVADMMQGVGMMRGGDAARSRHDGAALVHGALIAYGKYFDDPGWAP